MEVLKAFRVGKRLKIAVVGDAMVDVYYSGHVDRVSPEFPVQILHSLADTAQQLPGGAANVCYQMKHFNVDCFLVAPLDVSANSILGEYGFSTFYSTILQQDKKIPRKIRFYDNDFPLLRWDIEELYSIRYFDIFAQLASFIEKVDVVILSDYNKGLFADPCFTSQIIDLCNQYNVPTIVDPKKDLSKWKGCTIFKPNSKEAEILTKEKDWKIQSDIIMKELGCQGVVITQQGSGVVGKNKDYFEYHPTAKLAPKEVNSVIGAGDCFAAVLAIGLGYKLPLEEACKLAFEGGVEYVKARHNRPITTYDIHKRMDHASSKLIDLDELLYVKEHCFNGRWAFANGCFDILHAGHLETLKFAKQQGDYLVVGVNNDESTKRLKGATRPIIPLAERMKMLSAVEYVDFVIPFSENTPYELIKKIKPNILVKSSEYKEEDVVGKDLVESVVLAPHVTGLSTTKIIEKIAMNRIDKI